MKFSLLGLLTPNVKTMHFIQRYFLKWIYKKMIVVVQETNLLNI